MLQIQHSANNILQNVNHSLEKQPITDEEQEQPLVLKRCESEIFDNTVLIQKGISALQIDSSKRSFSQVKNIQNLIEIMEFFILNKEKYGQKSIDKLVQNIGYYFLGKGKTILDPNIQNNYIYIMIQGNLLQKERNNKITQNIEFGNSFGQQIKLNHTATDFSYIEAQLDCEFIVINKQTYFSIVGLQEKKEIIEKIKYLSKYAFCSNWNYDSLKWMQMDMQVVKFKKGQIVFNEGSIRDKIFMVKSGQFQLNKNIIFQNKSSDKSIPFSLKIRQSIEICKLLEGDIFGEESNIIKGNTKRFYQAISISNKCEAYVFEYSQFQDHLASNQSQSLYLNCVSQMYRQRYDHTQNVIQEKSLIMKLQRSNKVISQDDYINQQEAVCYALDEEGFIEGDHFSSQFYQSLSIPYEIKQQQKKSQEKLQGIQIDNLNDIIYDDNYYFQNQQVEQVLKLNELNSPQIIYDSIISQHQEKQNNYDYKSDNEIQQNKIQINQIMENYQRNGKIIQSESSQFLQNNNLKLNIETSNLHLNNLNIQAQKNKCQIQKSELEFNFKNNKLDDENNKIKNSQNMNLDIQLGQQNQQIYENKSKANLLKFKQIKQQSSSINQNINFFKEQNNPINCIQLFQKFNSITNNNDQSNNKSINNNINNHLNNNQTQNSMQISQNNAKISLLNNPIKSPTQNDESKQLQKKKILFQSQTKFFNIIQNLTNNPQINNQSKNLLSCEQESSKNNEPHQNENINQYQNDEHENQNEYLKSKLLNRKKAVQLSPTKKQLRAKSASYQEQNKLKQIQINQNQFDVKKIDDTEQINLDHANNNLSFQEKSMINNKFNSPNKKIIQHDLSTKNTSRQSTSSQNKIIDHQNNHSINNTSYQSHSQTSNIFYFNSHYLNGQSQQPRFPISKNMSINNLSKIMNNSQNQQKQKISQNNRSQSESSFDQSQISQFQNQMYHPTKHLVNEEKYRIQIKQQPRPVSACRMNRTKNEINNHTRSESETQKEELKNDKNNLKNNSILTIKLKRQALNQFNTQQQKYHSQTFTHFPQQSHYNKISLPHKKIQEILQIKTINN